MSDLTQFIDQVGKAAQRYYSQYRILPSLCIAQALLESNKANYLKGELKLSGLATDCHNYFGMKWVTGCGCDYKEYLTKEQKPTGEYYTVKAKFRKYDSLEDGIKGYFDFLNYRRYENLKGVTDYKKACELIRADGWATSLTYTQNLIKRIEYLKLYNYDTVVTGVYLEAGLSQGLTNNQYLPQYKGTSNSLVDALNSVGADSSYNYRKKLAAVNNVAGYMGTANQNTYLLALLKQGKLIKP